MGWFETFQKLNVFVDGLSSIDDLSPYLWKVHRESCELLLDLICQFSSMAENEGRYWLRVLRQLMEDGEDKYSGLAHTRFGLAEHIDTNHCIWDAFLLDL